MIEFKTQRCREDWDENRIAEKVQDIAVTYAGLRMLVLGLPTTMTAGLSTREEDARLGRKSKTHVEGRAADFRVDVTQMDLEDLIRKIINIKYSTGISSMPRIPPLRHGSAPHAHIQITRGELATEMVKPAGIEPASSI